MIGAALAFLLASGPIDVRNLLADTAVRDSLSQDVYEALAP